MKKLRWEILFEDDDVIVINKPAPYLTIPDRYDKTIPSLLGILKERRSEIFINHRLDKETSGLILMTKNENAHKHLSAQFENRKVTKHYLALVHGVPIEEIGEINISISESTKGKKGMQINQKGKESITKYRIIDSWNYYSYLEIKTLTGRQHQIRVHMKAINCPLVCDSIYGDGQGFYLSSIKRKLNRDREKVERPLLKRLALHASFLSFEHPTSSKLLSFELPVPKDIKAVVNQLGKCFPKS